MVSKEIELFVQKADIENIPVQSKKKANDGDASVSVASVNTLTRIRKRSGLLIIALILVLGAATCSAFLGIGLKAAIDDEETQFNRRAEDFITRIQRSWEDYVTAASWIHGRCRDRDFTRSDFRNTYEYLINSGLDFQAAQFDPNITNEERPAAEAEARAFYEANYPSVKYRGFVGFNYDNSTTLDPRNEAPFYFPIHYMEPVIGNERAIDLDYHASGSRKRTVLFCMENGLPALTDRLVLVQETLESAFGVVLMHPGYPLTGTADSYLLADQDEEEVWPRDLASIVIRIPDLIRRAAQDESEPKGVYIYDASDSSGLPLFLGAAILSGNGAVDLMFQPEMDIEEVRKMDALIFEDVVQAANKEWIVLIHSVDGTYQPQFVYVILGSVIIFIASVALAFWVYSSGKRLEAFNRIRSQADAEKAALILDNARQATKAERELNDFIAHEVRNPVAAAMSACSFVRAAVGDAEPLSTPEQRQETREDVEIIDNALRFVNDLLRNMLDMHRAANQQLKVNMTPTDLLHDVLEPVHAMLPHRDATVEVRVDCPESLVVVTDRLRLKQVCLNLARNSVKFVDSGFIRLRASVVDGEVVLCIEDSGPGIPKEKRRMLFSKFQESLDSLSQGTGIGLFLCQNLVALMEGEIFLDEDYDSGVPGNPGTRFVVQLKREPIDDPGATMMTMMHDCHLSSLAGTGETCPIEFSDASDLLVRQKDLPEALSVLFVDDDPILRKLFSRTVRTVAPGWKIREASNGETALRLVDTASFDLIFVDMYMASVEKQLLGTETVRELRTKGVSCRICGLSANDKETEFLEAGADVFAFKPFPCESRALTRELLRVLFREEEEEEEETSIAHAV